MSAGSGSLAAAHALEPLEADAERKQVHAAAEPGGPLPQLLGGDEHQVGLAEQPLFARHDASARQASSTPDRRCSSRSSAADRCASIRSSASGVGRNVQTIGRWKPVARIQRRSARSRTKRLIQRATREYGQRQQQRRVDEQVRPLLAGTPWCRATSCGTRWRTRGRSRICGARTPVFSTNSTRWPSAASVDMISWWPCQMKSQSIDEMQRMSDRRWIMHGVTTAGRRSLEQMAVRSPACGAPSARSRNGARRPRRARRAELRRPALGSASIARQRQPPARRHRAVHEQSVLAVADDVVGRRPQARRHARAAPTPSPRPAPCRTLRGATGSTKTSAARKYFSMVGRRLDEEDALGRGRHGRRARLMPDASDRDPLHGTGTWWRRHRRATSRATAAASRAHASNRTWGRFVRREEADEQDQRVLRQPELRGAGEPARPARPAGTFACRAALRHRARAVPPAGRPRDRLAASGALIADVADRRVA